MCDFVIQFDPMADAAKAAALLRDRPGMSDATIHTHRFPWGTVVIQEPRGRGYAPYLDNGELFACIARPRFMGITHEDRGPDGFNRIFAEKWFAGQRKDLFDALTGMYALVHCHDSGVDILTDQMGFQPVYVSSTKEHGAVVLGTDVEAVACASSRTADLDLTSLGELIVYNYVTFPFTSREGIRELEPATLYGLDETRGLSEQDTFWLPKEPEQWLSRQESVDQIETAIRFAAQDVTRGADTVAVTLSGGMDSRTVFAAIPREKRVVALTYATKMNREVEVAREVARAWGVEHVLAWREPEFYAKLLLERGPGLLGIERRGAAHGFGVVDNGLGRSYDLILGGQLSDTLLKDHYMPKHEKEVWRTKYLPERCKTLAKRLLGVSAPPGHAASPLSTVGRHLLEEHLQPSVRQAVRERRKQRLETLRDIRPRSAEEWVRFWPTSRQDDLAHVSGNMKLFAFDSLFMHRRIVEPARRIAPRYRYAGRAAHDAFMNVFGHLGAIRNANTLLPANASERSLHRMRKRTRQLDNGARPQSDDPWNDVQGSWVDLKALQIHSPYWREGRNSLRASRVCEILDQVLGVKASSFIDGYDDALTPGFNVMVMQLACFLDSGCAFESLQAVHWKEATGRA